MAKKSELDRVKELMDKRSKENPVEEIKEETEAEQLKKRLAELESKEKDKDEPVEDPIEETEETEKPKITISPLVDNGIYRQELLIRLDFQNEQLRKIATALEDFKK